VKIPEEETTYWFAVRKLPDFLKKKHHIVKVKPTFFTIYMWKTESTKYMTNFIIIDGLLCIVFVVLSQWEGALSHDGHGIIHHIEVFHCQLPADQVPVQFDQKAPSMSERPKGLESCRNVLGAWAMGAPVILVCTGIILHVF
jgi:dopamine beta-monooxygenase